jgi:hypothetical protein
MMEQSSSYKRIDTVPKLLEYLWSLFPNIIALKNGEPASSMTGPLNKKMYEPMIQNSVEFCDLLSKNILKIQPFAQGGFGQVGALTIDEDKYNQPLKAIILSFRRYGGFEPFYVSVIIKLYLSSEPPKWSIGETEVDKGTLYISDPLSEMIFGSMLGHLYDLGICPFFTKYFGAYLCKNEKTSIITERATIELRKLISRTKSGIAQRYPSAVINILFQYVYGLFIMKTYYGMVHFDTQHRNIMATYIHDREIKINERLQSYIYQGEDLTKKDFFLFQTHLTNKHVDQQPDSDGNEVPVLICIKNTGLLLKIIDYGVCVSYLDRSLVPEYKNDITISSIDADLTRIGALGALKQTVRSKSYSNTVDLQYTLTNMWEHMTKGLDSHTGSMFPDPNAPHDYKDALQLLDYFSEKFFGEKKYRLSNYLQRHPDRQVQLTSHKGMPGKGLAWVSYIHDTGIEKESFDSPLRLLEGLLNVCGQDNSLRVKAFFKGSQFQGPNGTPKEVSIFYFEPDVPEMIKNANGFLSDANSMLLSNSASEREKSLNLFSNYVSNANMYRDNCSVDKSSVQCKNIETNMYKYSLSSLSSKKLYSPSSKQLRDSLNSIPSSSSRPTSPQSRNQSPLGSPHLPESPSSDSSEEEIFITFEELPPEKLIKRTPIFDYYQIPINPAALNLNRNARGAQVYQRYQSWFDFKNVREEKVGEYVETVFLHAFRLRGAVSSVELDKGKDLWQGALEHFSSASNEGGLAVNGGYFIVPGNLNKLYPNLTENDLFEPIGFSYNNKFNTNGTKLSFPSVYHNDLAYVFGRGGQINVMGYNEFMSLHQTVDDTVRYEVKDEDHEILEETVKAIAMVPFISEDVEADIIGTRPFKADGSEVTDSDYTWAFCTGPILIWDGKVVFTESKMNTELMTKTVEDDTSLINSGMKEDKEILVTAVPSAKNSYKFRSAEGEGNQFYGMRHSHRYMVHNILAIDMVGRPYFIFCEGRGFDAPGLDRVQLANLISVFGMKIAVSLDGGFSANAVYKDCEELNKCRPLFALNDPEKRKLGLSIYIT